MAFLVAKNGVVRCVALGEDFFVEDGLLADVRERGPVEVEPRSAREHAREAPLVGEVSANADDAEDQTVLGKGRGEAVAVRDSRAECGEVCLWRAGAAARGAGDG